MPTRSLFICILFLLLLAVQAKSQQTPENSSAITSLYSGSTFYFGEGYKLDSTDFFRELKAFSAAEKKQHETDELYYRELFLRCKYYLLGKQKNYRLFESCIQELKELVDNSDNKEFQIHTRIELAGYYFNVTRNYGPGFDNFLDAYRLLKESSVKEVRNKSGLLFRIGMAYYEFGDNAKARKLLTEALQHSLSHWQVSQEVKRRQTFNIINTLGLIYRHEKNYDSAVYYFRKCYRIAERQNDSTWMGIAAGNIGICFYKLHQYREAIPLLELDIQESIKSGETDNAINSLMVLARINLRNKELEKTESQILQVRKLLPDAKKTYQHQKTLYPLLAQLYALKGNHKRAFLYSDSAIIIRDSLYAQQENLMALRAENKLQVEKHQADMRDLVAQKKLQAILRNSLIGGILLLIVIGLLIIKHLKIMHRQKQLTLESEKDYFASELEIASRQLVEFTNSIREKNNLLEKYTAEIESLSLRGGKVMLEASTDTYEKLLQATILTDEQWKTFRQLFDKVHAGYLLRLHEKLPDLSQAETRYFVLSKLNIEDREMAAMLGVRPDTIRNYRYRLRKKLNIEADDVLEDLIQYI